MSVEFTRRFTSRVGDKYKLLIIDYKLINFTIKIDNNCTIKFAYSNDNVNWTPLSCVRLSDSASVNETSADDTFSHDNLNFLYIRFRVTSKGNKTRFNRIFGALTTKIIPLLEEIRDK